MKLKAEFIIYFKSQRWYYLPTCTNKSSGRENIHSKPIRFEILNQISIKETFRSMYSNCNKLFKNIIGIATCLKF